MQIRSFLSRFRPLRPPSYALGMMMALILLNVFVIPMFDYYFDIMAGWVLPIRPCLDLLAHHIPAYRLSVEELPHDRARFIGTTMALTLLESLTFFLCCLAFFHRALQDSLLLNAPSRAVTTAPDGEARFGHSVRFTSKLEWRIEKIILVIAGNFLWIGGLYMAVTPYPVFLKAYIDNHSDQFLLYQSAMFLIGATSSFYLIAEATARVVLAWRNRRFEAGAGKFRVL